MSNTAIQGTIALVIFGLIVLIMIGLSQSPVVVQTDNNNTNEVIVLDGEGGQPVISPVASPVTSAGINQATSASAAGQVAPNAAPSSADVIVYTVQAGDGLYRIAQTYDTSVDAILALNPEVTDPDLIRPGQTLRIPAP